MRWGLLGVRLLMVAVNVVIAIIILLSFLPLVQGDINIDIPESGSQQAFDNGVMTISQPVDIYNGGYYDIQDFRASITLRSGDTILVQDTTPSQNIQTGKTTTVNLEFSLDLNSLSDEAKRSLVFNSTGIDVSVGIHAAYTLGLVSFDVNGNQSMFNEPMISNWNINTNAITALQNGSTVDILIPYSFSASQYLNGQQMEVNTNITNSTSSRIGSGVENIQVSNMNNGVLVVTLDPQAADWLSTHSDQLDISVDVSLFGVGMTNYYTYNWNPGAI